jgi:hypothetical protein
LKALEIRFAQLSENQVSISNVHEMAGDHRPPLLSTNERHIMNKTMLFVTALLLSAMPYAITQSISDGSWTIAILKPFKGTPPADPDWGPEQHALIAEASKELNNATVRYKKEEHEVTISINGLSNISSIETSPTSKSASIKIPNGSINIGVGGSIVNPIGNMILIIRSIMIPKEKPEAICGQAQPQQQLKKLVQCNFLGQGDVIHFPIIKNFDHKKDLKVRFWNILSVLAVKNDDTVIITFTIDPKTDKGFDPHAAEGRGWHKQDNSYRWS